MPRQAVWCKGKYSGLQVRNQSARKQTFIKCLWDARSFANTVSIMAPSYFHDGTLSECEIRNT